jgi:hypothetical protein
VADFAALHTRCQQALAPSGKRNPGCIMSLTSGNPTCTYDPAHVLIHLTSAAAPCKEVQCTAKSRLLRPELCYCHSGCVIAQPAPFSFGAPTGPPSTTKSINRIGRHSVPSGDLPHLILQFSCLLSCQCTYSTYRNLPQAMPCLL